MTILKGLCIPLLAVCVAVLMWSSGSCEEDTLINGVILFVEDDLYNPDPEKNLRFRVAVFGQLTLEGDPVANSGFALGVNFGGSDESDVFVGKLWSDRTISLTRKGAGGGAGDFFAIYYTFGEGIEADGAQISYIIGSRRFLTYDINSRDLSDSYRGYTTGRTRGLGNSLADLLEDLDLGNTEEPLGKIKRFWLPELPVDPPGEAHVAFF